MEILFSGISVVVLLLILRFQFINRKKAQEKSSVVTKILEDEDWESDVGSNTVLDWFDRLVAPPLDDIRRFSNVALVTGIGGTMGIFFLEVVFLFLRMSPSSSLPEGVITGMIVRGGIALFSSLFGIGLHLQISSRILDKVQNSVSQKERDIIKASRTRDGGTGELSRKQSPDVADFVKAVKRFLERQDSLNASVENSINSLSSLIGDALQQQQESAGATERNIEDLANELKTLPETIRRSLDTSVENSMNSLSSLIGDAMQQQQESTGATERNIEELANELKTLPETIRGSLDTSVENSMNSLSSLIGDALQQQQESAGATERNIEDLANELKTLPETIRGSLDTSVENSMNSLSSLIGDALQQQQESARGMERNIEELTNELKTLPETIRRSFEVNEVFEKVARSYIGELYEVFKEHRGKLNETIVENQKDVRYWLANQIDAVMREITEGLKGTIEKDIIAPLADIREQLDKTTHEMPGAARDFASELQEAAKVLSTISERLEKFPESIHEAVSLTASETLHPVSVQIQDFNKTVEDTHRRLENVIEGLVNLIKNLVQRIEARRQ